MNTQTKNTHGGKDYKRKKTRRDKTVIKKEVVMDVENGDGYYAKVLKLLGTNRVLVKLHNNIEAQVTIPGRLYKKVWIKPDNYILVNNYMEIEKVYNDLDKDTDHVKKVFIQKTGEESSEQIITLPKVETSKIERQEKEKARQISRSEGRHFTNPDELEKQVINKNNDDSSENSEYDISKI